MVVGSCHNRMFSICRKGPSVILQSQTVLMFSPLPSWGLRYCLPGSWIGPLSPPVQNQAVHLTESDVTFCYIIHCWCLPFMWKGSHRMHKGISWNWIRIKICIERPPVSMLPIRLLLVEKAWALTKWKQNPWFSTWVSTTLCNILKSFLHLTCFDCHLESGQEGWSGGLAAFQWMRRWG